jgi:acetyl-CoA carboxylase biotin carboxylase subunit
MRVYAEDPERFLPSPGRIDYWRAPEDPWVRVDQGYEEGSTVTAYYDPLLAKLCVYAPSRDELIERAYKAVQSFAIKGLKVNLPFFEDLLQHPRFRRGDYDTGIVAQLRPKIVG